MRRLCVLFLIAQGASIAAWWLMLFLRPDTRAAFMAPGADDATLLAFGVGDLLLYGGGSLVAAWGLVRRARWAWPALCVVAGAGLYAALYSVSLPLLSGGGWLGAVIMAPVLLLLPTVVWLSRGSAAR